MRQRRPDAPGLGRIALPSHHRVEPDDAAAAFCQRRHFSSEQGSVAGLVAVGHDHHAAARMDHPRGMPAIKGLQALADPGAAARALRHDRQPVQRASRIPFLHRVGDVGKTGVKQERLGLAKFVEHAVDEAQEHRRVHAHRAGRIEQDDEPQRLVLASPQHPVDRHAAVADIAVNGSPQIQPLAAPPRQIAAGEPRPHGLRQSRRGDMRLFDLLGVRHLAEIDLGEIFRARGALHQPLSAASFRRVVR